MVGPESPESWITEEAWIVSSAWHPCPLAPWGSGAAKDQLILTETWGPSVCTGGGLVMWHVCVLS